jgi:D-alanyl-D-alanine carboxypeptidase (penicillin-binding protein 5/6)
MILLLFTATVSAEETAVAPTATRDPNAVPYDYDHPERLLPEQIVAHAFVLMELETGDILMQRGADEEMYPASTTKIMTALLTLEDCEMTAAAEGVTLDEVLNRRITISESAVDIPADASKAGLRAGDSITILDALYGMMLESGNDAANALAEYVSGSQEKFVDYMNDAAGAFGLTNTHFMNPHGYHDPDHYISALDMAAISKAAMRKPIFRKIVSTLNYTISSGVRNALNLYNSNRLIDPGANTYYYRYATGVKTGTHSMADHTLVAAAEKDGVTLLAVLLFTNEYSRWADAKWLFEYGFTQYTSLTPEQIYNKDPYTIQATSFSLSDEGMGELTLAIEAVDPNETARITGPNADVQLLMESYRSYTTIQWTRGRQPRAPIYQGEVLGVMTFYTPDGEASKYNLIAPRDIAARTDAPLTLEEIEELARTDPLPLPPFSWDWITPPAIAFVAMTFAMRSVVRWVRNARRDARQIPKPKRRTYR